MSKRLVKVGFVGGGWMARAHARAIATINVLGMTDAKLELASIVTRDPSKVEMLAESIGFERGVSSLDLPAARGHPGRGLYRDGIRRGLQRAWRRGQRRQPLGPDPARL